MIQTKKIFNYFRSVIDGRCLEEKAIIEPYDTSQMLQDQSKKREYYPNFSIYNFMVGDDHGDFQRLLDLNAYDDVSDHGSEDPLESSFRMYIDWKEKRAKMESDLLLASELYVDVASLPYVHLDHVDIDTTWHKFDDTDYKLHWPAP